MSDLRRIIWLASFPKSGNTWMRSLLAHYFMPKGKAPDINNLRQFTTADVRADFFDAAVGGRFVATSPEDWIKVRPQALRLIAGSRPNHHFVKTHCPPVKFMGVDLIPPDLTAAAIYIIRNPFDVAPSFARHQSVDVDEAITMMANSNSITGTQQGIYDVLGRWDEHVTSWTGAPGLPMHVVRYEDLLSRPGPTMRQLLEKFLKVNLDKPKLAYAIQSTSFDAMKRQEEKLGFLERPKGMKSFFAKGKAGAWREDLTPDQVGRLLAEFHPVIERWYPEMVDETEAFSAGN